MTDIMFKGITTALVTPFSRDGKVDEDGLRALIDYQIEGGVDGIAVVAGSGEAVNITPSEQDLVVRISVEHVAGRIQVIAGVLAPDTGSAVTWSRKACELGIDALLVLTPFYNRPSKTGVIRHFKAISDATDKPILIYNNPGRTGISLDIDDYVALVDAGRFVGVKECNRDLADFSRVVAELGDRWAILSGEDDLLYPSLELGASGGIITTGNVLPRIWADMYAAIIKGDHAKARAAHYAVLPFIRAVYTLDHPALVKDALRVLGLPGGRTRLPLMDPSSEQSQLIKDVLKRCLKG